MLTFRIEFVTANPSWQEQLYPPTVLMQVEFGPHGDGVNRHSSTSVKGIKKTDVINTFQNISHSGDSF